MAFSLGGLGGAHGGCGCCGGPDCTACSPCCIPNRDLSLADTTYGTKVLHYAPGYLVSSPPGIKWHTDCFAYPGPSNARYVFGCNAANQTVLSLQVFFNVGPPRTAAPCTPDFSFPLPGHAASIPDFLAWTCTPFSLSYGSAEDALVTTVVTAP